MFKKSFVLGFIILLFGTCITVSPGISDEITPSIDSNKNYKKSFINVGEEQFGMTPFADFSYSPEDPIIYSRIEFKDKSTDQQGKIIAWWWDFDDGYYSDLQNPAHYYFTAGTYNVSLTVTNDTGFSDTAQKGVLVNEDDVPPYVEIIAPKPRYIEFTIFGITIRISRLITLLYGKIYVVVNAYDNVGVESVTFYVDGEKRNVDFEPPYTWLWNEHGGMLLPYELKVVARDFAGNEATDMMKVWRSSVRPLGQQ